MRLELLTVPDCPNGPVLKERLMLALAGCTDVELTAHVVEGQAEAERRGMHGSPTLLIDGRDPFAPPGTAASLSCRTYGEGDRQACGAPSVEQLRQVLGITVTRGVDQTVGRVRRHLLAPAERGLRAVQQAILRSFATTGSPPKAAELESAAEPFGPAARVLVEPAAEGFLTPGGTGRVQAAYPFSAMPTEHAVQIAGGPMVWAMGAIDALGIPAMLGTDAVITYTDPVTGNPVRVGFTGERTTWQPVTLVVYYVARPGDDPAAAVCCGYLRFFTARATAQQWTGQHSDISGAVLDKAETEAERGANVFGLLLGAPAQ
ncbi:alkylmercury lyase family protein [Streptomyces sp. NPDC047022]|uniref:alkylmercury lyase family protein n=1 Tax=Streptomyces sp. NPDC047022 TaxID=3155737 RepID=UPI003411529E